MKKLNKLVFILVVFVMILTSCKNNYELKDIKADNIIFSYGSNVYTENVISEQNLNDLIQKIKAVEIIGETKDKIDNKNAICINFIYKDKEVISITIDEKGIFKINNTNYNIVDADKLYEYLNELHQQIKSK